MPNSGNSIAANFNHLGGLPVIAQRVGFESTTWTQVRFPRSKKRRIRKKWSKDRRNYQATVHPIMTAMRVGDVLYMHPILWEQIKQGIKEVSETCYGSS